MNFLNTVTHQQRGKSLLRSVLLLGLAVLYCWGRNSAVFVQDEPFKKVIERLDRMGSTPDFYSGCRDFISQPGDRLS